ncbi:MAG: hypothetical protein GEU78_09600 [Actinobacteria bacterium]|nr:hypothetical protein [Actinomycetota bacterium]
MGKLREDARSEYVTALRALRTGGEQADFVRHRLRALVEDIDNHCRDETGAVVLEPEQYKELQWALGLLDAQDQMFAELLAELRRRASEPVSS